VQITGSCYEIAKVRCRIRGGVCEKQQKKNVTKGRDSDLMRLVTVGIPGGQAIGHRKLNDCQEESGRRNVVDQTQLT